MELEWKEELDRNDWKKSTPALTIAGSQGHINNYWTRHTLFLTDEHTQSCMCNGQINEHSSRRSRIFVRRRPLSCEVPSRRDSVGPPPHWIAVVAEFFRRLYNSRRDLMGPFYIFWHSRRGGRAPPLWIGHCILTDEHTQSFMCNGQINERMSCEQWHNYFYTNYTHLFSAQSESIDTSLTHIMPLFSLLQVESPVRFDWVIRHWVRKKYSRRHICNTCHHKIGEIYMNDSIWWLFIPNVALSSVPMHRCVAGTMLLQNRIASTSATWRQWCLPCQWCWHRPQHF